MQVISQTVRVCNDLDVLGDEYEEPVSLKASQMATPPDGAYSYHVRCFSMQKAVLNHVIHAIHAHVVHTRHTTLWKPEHPVHL